MHLSNIVSRLILPSLTLAILSAVSAHSQTLSGRVLDEEGTPIPGATVSFTRIRPPDQLTRQQVTDSQGRYRVELPPGLYRYSATTLGRQATPGVIEPVPGASQTLDIVLLGPTAPFPGLPTARHFNLYDINYFAFGFGGGTGLRPDSENSNQVKFRVAVRYKLVGPACLKCREGFYAAYSQTSFWHLYDTSAPFFDNNYSPGVIGFLPLTASGTSRTREISLFVGYFHESNGRDGAFSRGWNRMVAGASFGSLDHSRLSGSVALWHAQGLEDTNTDLAEFAGRGEVEAYLQPFAGGAGGGPLTIQLRSRILGNALVQNIEANALWHLPGRAGEYVFPAIMTQIFSGYAENLLTYDEKRTVFRLGIAVLR